MRQHGIAAIAQCQRDAGAGLQGLVEESARFRLLHARNLHGNGGSAGAAPDGAEILPGRPADRVEIDAGMLKKPAVFESERCLDEAIGQSLQRPIAIIDASVLAMADLREERTAAIIEDGRRPWRDELCPLRDSAGIGNRAGGDSQQSQSHEF